MKRQGDILFEKVDELGCQILLDTKTVALGELTGHHHSFKKQDQVLLYGTTEAEYVQIPKGEMATLTHQEHKPLELEEGIYKIKREQSYNPFLKKLQRSVD